MKPPVFDPMFVPHRPVRTTPAYTRRASVYSSANSLTVRPNLTPKAPVAARISDVVPRVQPVAKAVVRPAQEARPTKVQPESVAAQPPEPKAKWPARLRPANRQTAVLYGMAGVVFLIGLAVSLSGLHTNHQVAAQVKHSQKQTDQTTADHVVPSAVKPSAAVVRNYVVSPNVPRYLDIPKLKVHTRVLSEGVTKSGQLQVPWNIYDTGWYNASSQPGQNGAVLIDGHSGIGTMHGVFYKLASMAAGDQISLTRGDGRVFTYSVVKTQTVNAKDVDMASMLVSADTSRPGLNLITCAGDQIPGTTELNKRVLVYAIMQ